MKNRSHKYNHGRRLRNPYVWAIIVPFITIVFIIPSYFRMAEEKKFVYVNEGYLNKLLHYRQEDEKMALLTAKCKEMGAHVKGDTCEYSKEEMRARVKHYFPNSYHEMLAIIPAEGGWSMNKQNWNCYYKGYWENYEREDGAIGKRSVITDYTPLKKQTKGVISTSCQKKADRTMAWSTDCFLLQKNYVGRLTCPDGVSLNEHLAEVANMTREGNGLGVFSSYWANNHLTYK